MPNVAADDNQTPSGGTPPSGARKPMTPSERARHASLVRWGKEQPFAARLEAVRARRKAAKAKKAKGGGKGKGKTAKPTAAEKEAERAKQMLANVEAVGDALNESDNAMLSKNGLAGLISAANGEEPDSNVAQGLIDKGLAVRGEDGRYRLTSDGQAIVRAAESGDTSAVLDRLSAVNDKNVARSEKEKAKADKEAEKVEKEKKGGGGGGGKEKPTEEEKEQAKLQAKAEKRAKVGAQLAENDADLSERGLEALASLASGEEVDEALVDGLAEMGLVEVDSDGRFRATVQGRAAVRAAERGDYGATVDAVSRAKDRKAKQKERDEAKKKRQEERRRREDERRAREDERRRQEDGEDEGDGGSGETEGRKQRDDDTSRGRKPRDNRGPARPKYELYGKSAVKHGAHDQSSHGRRGARGKAAGAAYRGARAGGASIQEARQAANDVSQIHANQQRISNIDRQLQGEISDKQTASLVAERDRLVADNTRRAVRIHPGAAEQANAAYNANPAPTVRGRAGALNDYDQQFSVSRARRDETRGSLEQAKRDLEWRESSLSSAQNASTSIRRQYERERNEAKREVARLEKQLRGYERAVERNRGLYERELARPAFSQRRAAIYAQRERLRAYNPDYGKALEMDMPNMTPLLEDLETLCNEAHEIAMEGDAEIKAGRRNNSADQADIDRGYALAEELCALFEALGATVEEEEEKDETMEGDAAMSGKSINYDQAAQLVRDAWVQQAKPASDNAPYRWPQAVFDDGVVISQDGVSYFVPYSREAGAIVFADRSQWKQARQTYITADGEVKINQPAIDLIESWRKEDSEEKWQAADALPNGMKTKKADGTGVVTIDELMVYPGESVKALDAGSGWTQGYLIRFGGNGDLTEWRDVFRPPEMTDYGHAKTSDVWVHHRMLPGVGKRRLTNPAELSFDDEGIFIKHLLNMRDPYERRLYDLVQQGKLGWSSGVPSHLAERKALDGGRHEIVCWPLGCDSSYTPCPAGGFSVDAKAVKSLFDEAGLDLLAAIYEEPAPLPTDEERVRMLTLKLRALKLEAI